MTETTDELGWTVPTPGGDAGDWGAILNQCINNDIEPDVAAALAQSDAPPSYPGSVVMRAYDDAADEMYMEAHSSIQQAINAMPLQDNEYAPDARTGGEVFVYSKAGTNAYDQGQVVLNRKGKVRAIGTYAEISYTGPDAAVLVTNDGSAPSPDDAYLTGLWIENLGGGMALRSTEDETHIEDINLEDAGDIAIDFEGQRCTAFNCEIKGGGFRVSGDQAYISDILVHNELGHGFSNGWELAGNYNSCVNCHGWLDRDNDGAVISGNKNRFVGSVGQSPKRLGRGRTSRGLTISGDNNAIDAVVIKTETAARVSGSQNYIRLNIANTTNGVSIDPAATENVIEGRFGGPLTGDTGRGVRNVINGQSVNSGDPNTTGDWNGHADYAHRLGAVVWDTSVSPNVPYRAGPGGNWRQD